MSTTKLKLIKTDSEWVEAVGVMTEYNGNRWFHIPFWYEKVGDGLYVEHRLEDLPEGFKQHIKSLREKL